jgi:hypothetical protein
MSWHASYKNKSDFVNDVRSHESGDLKAAQDQVSAARAAAKVVLDSGAVGDSARRDFSVSISGHSNPNHLPAAKYANDMIQVAVYQLTEA